MISHVYHNSAEITLKADYQITDKDYKYIVDYWGSGDTNPFIHGVNQKTNEVFIVVPLDMPLKELSGCLDDLKQGLGLEPKENFIWFIN